MDPKSIELLNSPLAVVVILAMVLGFLGMAFREFSWWFKSMKKATPSDHIERSNQALAETMKEVGHSLMLLNEKMEHHAERSKTQQETILYEVREIRGKLD